MRTLIRATALSLGLLVTAPASSAEPAPSGQAQAEALIAEVLKNVNWELLLKLQQTLMENFDTVIPYTEEYIACLKSEGVMEEETTLDLRQILIESQSVAKRCNVVLESLAGRIDFSLSEKELEEGLSPEYRELLKKSL